jgi:hypothetical protein
MDCMLFQAMPLRSVPLVRTTCQSIGGQPCCAPAGDRYG